MNLNDLNNLEELSQLKHNYKDYETHQLEFSKFLNSTNTSFEVTNLTLFRIMDKQAKLPNAIEKQGVFYSIDKQHVLFNLEKVGTFKNQNI